MQEFANSTLVLSPGVYILRHPGNAMAPLSIGRAHGTAPDAGRIETMGTPGTHGALLRSGADCIVLQVLDAPVTLLVSAFLSSKGAAVPQLRCDRVGLEQAAPVSAPVPAVQAPPAPAGTPIMIGPKGISLIGHIQAVGDVVANEGQQLGKAGEQLRIEGFQIMWPDRPEGVDLHYAITVEGMGRSPAVGVGQFCGTRGQARRIVEATFALTGPLAQCFRLEGHAIFSGGFQIPITNGVPLGGPSGMEHLTGLSLRAVPVPSEQGADVRNPWTESANTQIFKAPNTEVPAAVQKRRSEKAGGRSP